VKLTMLLQGILTKNVFTEIYAALGLTASLLPLAGAQPGGGTPAFWSERLLANQKCKARA